MLYFNFCKKSKDSLNDMGKLLKEIYKFEIAISRKSNYSERFD